MAPRIFGACEPVPPRLSDHRVSARRSARRHRRRGLRAAELAARALGRGGRLGAGRPRTARLAARDHRLGGDVEPGAGTAFEDQRDSSPLMRGTRLQLHWHADERFRFASASDRMNDWVFRDNLSVLDDLGWPLSFRPVPRTRRATPSASGSRRRTRSISSRLVAGREHEVGGTRWHVRRAGSRARRSAGRRSRRAAWGSPRCARCRTRAAPAAEDHARGAGTRGGLRGAHAPGIVIARWPRERQLTGRTSRRLSRRRARGPRRRRRSWRARRRRRRSPRAPRSGGTAASPAPRRLGTRLVGPVGQLGALDLDARPLRAPRARPRSSLGSVTTSKHVVVGRRCPRRRPRRRPADRLRSSASRRSRSRPSSRTGRRPSRARRGCRRSLRRCRTSAPVRLRLSV